MLQFYMIKTLRTELIYFIAILVVLALVLHPDLLSTPLDRLELMKVRENYLHPFYWTLGVYLMIVVVRLIIKGFTYLKNKMKK